jgi:GNAT superfamily N-acetyltransferase
MQIQINDMNVEIYCYFGDDINSKLCCNYLKAEYHDGRLGANASLSWAKSYTALFFNNLYVDHILRRKGVATALMKAVCKKVDEEGLDIILYINSYGDLNESELEAFYKKFGFELGTDCYLFRKHSSDS